MADAGYVVKYGRGSYLGRFTCMSAETFSRGTRVVVRSPRGVELGEVLCPADDSLLLEAAAGSQGTLLRIATAHDDEADQGLHRRGEALLADAQQSATIQGLPIAFLDVEVFLDGSAAVLHAIHWADCEASPLFDRLSQEHGLTVKLHDDSRRERVHNGCGKPGCGSEGGGCDSCGSEGGGCSTGSCSRGSVKSAAELTAYFAALRAQMEAHAHRHPLV